MNIYPKNNFIFIEYFLNPVVLTDKNGIIQYINKNAENLLNYNSKEVINQHINIFLPTYLRDKHENHIKNFDSNNNCSVMNYNRNVFARKKNGDIIQIEIILNRIVIKNTDYILANIIEISNTYIKLTHFKIFFDIGNDIFCIFTKEGVLIQCNNTFANMLHTTSDDIVKNKPTLFEIFDYEDKEKIINLLDIINTNNKINNYEINHKINNIFKRLIWNAESNNNLVYATAQDVTKNVIDSNIIKENEKISSLNEKIALIGSWKMIGNKILFNEGSKNILKIQYNELSIDDFCSFVKYSDKDINESLKDSLINNNENELMFNFIDENNDIVWVYMKWIILKDKFNQQIIVGVFQDRTKQLIIETELIHQRDKAHSMLELRSQFIANISHEIRTPLNGIVGMLTLLQQSDLTEYQIEILGPLEESVGVLLSLINNILDFSKIESGKMTIYKEYVNIRSIIEYVFNIFTTQFESKKIIKSIFIDDDIPELIYTDEMKLKQILMNLIGNAIKFTEVGKISLNIYKQSNNIYFRLDDTGIGISQDKLQNLFTPFTQADSSITKNYSGSGLGLTITKNFIQLLDGDITITSEDKIGTSVTFYLPINDDIVLYKKSTKTAVIVEDNKINQFVIIKMIEKKLKDEIDNIIVCENGQNAIEQIPGLNPIIIYMDIHMPIMNGLDCSIKLREMGITTPIICITANTTSSMNEKIRSAGVNDIIWKPVNMDEFYSKTKYALNSIKKQITH